MSIRAHRRAGRAHWRTALLGLWLACGVAPAHAAPAQPLFQADSQVLFQRVLTQPGARVVKAPGDDRAQETPTPFTAYYVYAREHRAGADWIQVGPGLQKGPNGWLRADTVIDWPHAMVMTFNSAAQRQPVLFFDKPEALTKLLEGPQPAAKAAQYLRQIRAGSPPVGSGVIAVEPDTFVDIHEAFYLAPIFELRRPLLANRQEARLLQVASIPLASTPATPQPADKTPFRVGVVFVIDTTLSMDPYIERTRETVRRIQQRILNSPLASQVSFGMVGFRDYMQGRAPLEYVAKVLSPLRFPADHAAFLKDIESVRAAQASTQGFDEDGLAGIKAALDMPGWEPFAARYLIFISDAGVREPGIQAEQARMASTGLKAAEAAALAQRQGTAIFALHLQTAAGEASRAKAEEQLRNLSRWDQSDSGYFAVEGGDLAAFGPAVDTLTDTLIRQADDQSRKRANGTADAAAPLLETADRIGQAMRLAWLGRTQNTPAPAVLRAWASENALDDPHRKALKANVLLTRTQLSQLYVALKMVHESATQTLTEDPGLFFDRLQTVLARAANDPASLQGLDPSLSPQVRARQLDSLGDLLGEYLGNLPYRSALMGIDRDTWASLPKGEQDTHLVDIASKLQAYKYFNGDLDRWVALHPKADAADRVYPVPLELLP
ncbi:MAG: VWA domain-containing protein [Gammaproteobacteria bacterium]|nr:VWA domain-containing protein [Gammaproteobacteria bacterium]